METLMIPCINLHAVLWCFVFSSPNAQNAVRCHNLSCQYSDIFLDLHKLGIFYWSETAFLWKVYSVDTNTQYTYENYSCGDTI